MSDEHDLEVPLWLRLWHAVMALAFLVLLASGVFLHFGGGGGLATAVAVHEAVGILLTAIYVPGVAALAATGRWRRYVPARAGLLGRILDHARYYAFVLPRQRPTEGAAHARHFNPLQQCVYLLTLFLVTPVIAVTGVLYLFPQRMPAHVLGYAGLWPVALVHTLFAIFVAVFLLVHIYLALAAAPKAANLRMMVTGRWPPEGKPYASSESD